MEKKLVKQISMNLWTIINLHLCIPQAVAGNIINNTNNALQCFSKIGRKININKKKCGLQNK